LDHWLLDGVKAGSANPLTVTMSASQSVNPVFTQIQYTLTVNTSGSGSVAKNPSKATYTYGESVQLAATPISGWVFAGWSGDLTGSVNPARIMTNGNKMVNVTFTQNQHTVAVSTMKSGSLLVYQRKMANVPFKPVLVETPDTGYVFPDWSGGPTKTGGCLFEFQ
jgi:hypothetical protein